MRGLVLWTLIALLLLAVELVFLVENVFGAADEAANINTILNGEQAAGVVSLVQSAPVGTVHQYALPKGKCAINVRQGSINFTNIDRGFPRQYSKGYVSSLDIELDKKFVIAKDFLHVDCNSKKQTQLFFRRCENSIKVSLSAEGGC